jgi:hypothetical protein
VRITAAGDFRSLHGSALTVRVVSDHQCAGRNSFWNGTVTR